jgi:hypothetical protein
VGSLELRSLRPVLVTPISKEKGERRGGEGRKRKGRRGGERGKGKKEGRPPCKKNLCL